jgi:hypothetical protein
MKKFFSVMLIVLMIFSSSGTATAKVTPPPPESDYTVTVKVYLGPKGQASLLQTYTLTYQTYQELVNLDLMNSNNHADIANMAAGTNLISNGDLYQTQLTPPQVRSDRHAYTLDIYLKTNVYETVNYTVQYYIDGVYQDEETRTASTGTTSVSLEDLKTPQSATVPLSTTGACQTVYSSVSPSADSSGNVAFRMAQSSKCIT